MKHKLIVLILPFLLTFACEQFQYQFKTKNLSQQDKNLVNQFIINLENHDTAAIAELFLDTYMKDEYNNNTQFLINDLLNHKYSPFEVRKVKLIKIEYNRQYDDLANADVFYRVEFLIISKNNQKVKTVIYLSKSRVNGKIGFISAWG